MGGVVAYVLGTVDHDLEGGLAGEELKRHDAERPRVEGRLRDHAALVAGERLDDLRRGVPQAVADGRLLPSARDAAKVDDRPPVLPRQPHHVAGLEVPVHVPRSVHARELLSDVGEHLHGGGCERDSHAVGAGRQSGRLGDA